MSQAVKKLGLIGFPLGHSFSARYFNAKFASEGLDGWSYHNFPMESADEILEVLKSETELQGFNVTIPHKLAIMSHLSEIDSLAERIGAVNCVKVTRDGEQTLLKGYNTDITGFKLSLSDMLGEVRPKALVLGTGGASRAVIVALEELAIDYTLVSRTSNGAILSYEQLTSDIISDHKLIINTTPLGMHPKVDAAPELDYSAITSSHYIYDLIFNPDETLFLRLSREQGATIKNGYDMLVRQAEAWWDIISL